MKRALYIVPLLLLLLHTPGHAQQQAETPLIDTARINAMRDTIQWRLNQLLDINMLTACLQVRKIENVHGLSLLGPNEPLRDSIAAFENGYETSILVHSFINSNQFWPKALFNPNRLANDMVDPRVKPAVGFDVSFTPQGDSSQRRFAVNILNLSTPELLSQAQGERLLSVTKQGLASPFVKVRPAATDSVNAALFRGIAQLRTFWEEAQADCNIKRVTFSPADNARFGFSPLPHELLKAHYGSITVRGRAYSVPWQSLAAGTTEPVKFRVELLTGDTASHPVQLRSSSGAAITPVKNGDGSYAITLTAGSEGHEETIEAFYTDTLPGNKTKDMVVGALRTITYAPVQRTVIPVILNGAKLSVNPTTLTETLNGIYRQAAVTWSVKSAVKVEVQQHDWDVEDDGDGKLLIATSMFNRYSSEMQAIIDAIKKKVAPDPEACYLIITDIPNTMGYQGYMPLKSEFAFIFTQSQNEAYRTMAHELGHGAFYLKHPQDEYRIQEATDNLMDKYDQGSSLWKPQWDWIGDPSFRLYMFQQEEDGASQTTAPTSEAKWEKFIGDITTFITPAGLPITIPKPDSVLIAHGPSTYQSTDGKVYDIPSAANVLIAFKLENGVTYVPYIAGNNGENIFYGYITDPSKMDFFEESQTSNLPESFSVKLLEGASPVIKQCQIKPEQVFADAEYAQYNPNSKYRAAGPMAYRVDDISLKAKGFYYSAYKKAELFKESSILKIAIENDPGILKDAFTYRQYFIVKDWETSEKLFKLIFLGGLGVGAAPVAIEAVVPIAVEYGAKKAGDFAIGAIIDGTIQVVLLAADGQKFPEVVKNVDVFQMLRSGAENLVSDPALSAIVSCFSDGLMEGGSFKQQITAESFSSDCIWGAFSSLLSYGASEALSKSLPKLKQLFVKTPEKFKFALTNLGIPEGKADEIIDQITKKRWAKYSHLSNLDTKILDKIGSWDDELLEKLNRDLADNSNFATEFFVKVKGNEGLVESWKALGDFPTLRKNIPNLETLNKVKGKFTYNGKTGQAALEEIFTGHKSAQKFIDNLKRYDELIGEVDDITIIGIKSSSEVRILNNGNQVGKIVDGNLNVKYSGFGGDIVCDATKTTTGIGKYNPPGDVGTIQIIDSKLSKYVEVGDENPGGLNILADNRTNIDWSDEPLVWKVVNEPWLNDAISRGDIIRAVSNPMDVNNVFKATDNIPSSVLSSPENLANYLKNLNDPDIIKDLSFYGREVRHLYQNNYLFDLTSKTFVR